MKMNKQKVNVLGKVFVKGFTEQVTSAGTVMVSSVSGITNGGATGSVKEGMKTFGVMMVTAGSINGLVNVVKTYKDLKDTDVWSIDGDQVYGINVED